MIIKIIFFWIEKQKPKDKVVYSKRISISNLQDYQIQLFF